MKSILKRVGIGLGVLIALLLIWGGFVEPRWIDTEEHAALVPGLPAAWEGERVAVVADFQIGMWAANTGTMERITDILVRERPAAVLLAGDFIYKPGENAEDEVAKAVEILRPLGAAGIPTFAVLGNHDYSLNKRDDPKDERAATLVRRALEEIGIRVLNNEAIALGPPGSAEDAATPGAGLHFVGVGSAWAEEAQPARALQGVPGDAPRVVFMHNPDSFRQIAAGAAPFAVAGHTHGGQIRVPGTPYWSWLGIVTEGEPTTDGWIEDDYGQAGNRLYVNRGVGFSAIPIRINCRPEVTFFRLSDSATVESGSVGDEQPTFAVSSVSSSAERGFGR